MISNKIKNIILITIGVAALFFIIKSALYLDKVKVLEYERDDLLKKNKELFVRVDSLHAEYNKKELLYIKLDSALDNKTKEYNKLKLVNHKLQLKLTELENEMINITPDSSYNYLMHRYIPKQDSLPFRFAPNQVKSIHYDVLVLDNVKLINNNLVSTLAISDSLYYLTTFKFNTCREQTSILLSEKQLLSNSISNLESINKIYRKQLNNQKFISVGLGVGIAGYITYRIVKFVGEATKND